MITDERLNERREARIAAGRTAFDKINSHEHFRDWLAVADALVAIREAAMDAAHTNHPQGPPYRAALKAIRIREPWTDKVDSATTTACYWLIDNLPAVQAWRDTLTFKQRDEWNHPATVRRAYERLNVVKEPKPDGAAPPPQRLVLQDKVIELQAEVDLLRKKGGGGLLPGASVEEVTERLFEAHNAAFVKRLIVELDKRLAAEVRQDAIEARAAKRSVTHKGRRLDAGAPLGD